MGPGLAGSEGHAGTERIVLSGWLLLREIAHVVPTREVELTFENAMRYNPGTSYPSTVHIPQYAVCMLQYAVRKSVWHHTAFWC